MKRTASAHWEGTLKEGKGTLSTQSTVLHDTQFSFNTRFQDGIGTNPEELIAAAHAGCFTMAVGAEMNKMGLTPTSLDTTAVLSMDLTTLVITGIHLSLTGKVDGIDNEKFQAIAEDTKANCIISKALNVAITMDATLL